jgi:hypothetical protein
MGVRKNSKYGNRELLLAQEQRNYPLYSSKNKGLRTTLSLSKSLTIILLIQNATRRKRGI